MFHSRSNNYYRLVKNVKIIVQKKITNSNAQIYYKLYGQYDRE